MCCWSTLCLGTVYILKVNCVTRHVLDWAPDESNTNQPIHRKASIHLKCNHTTVVADFDLDSQNVLEPGIAGSCSLGVCPFKDNIFFDEIDQMAQNRHGLAWNFWYVNYSKLIVIKQDYIIKIIYVSELKWCCCEYLILHHLKRKISK